MSTPETCKGRGRPSVVGTAVHPYGYDGGGVTWGSAEWDGYRWVRRGVSSNATPTPVHDPGLDHLLEEGETVEVVPQDVLWWRERASQDWHRFTSRFDPNRGLVRDTWCGSHVAQVGPLTSELFRETTELKPERRCPHCMDPDRVTTPGEQPTDPGQQVPICAAEREDNSGWWTCTMLPGHEGWHHAYDEEGGTLCASWSAEPTTPVHDPGAGHEGWHRDGDCNWGTADREVEARCSKDHCDRLCDQALSDRDRYHEVADQLASLLAPPEVLGDHSSMNDPWQNAMDHAEGQAGRAAAPNSGQRLAEAREAVARWLETNGYSSWPVMSESYRDAFRRQADALLALPELRALIGGEQP